MADVATPSTAPVAATDAAAPQGKQQIVKPEKPDEEKYKADLAKAEKEHAAAQEKLVCSITPMKSQQCAQVVQARGPSRRVLASCANVVPSEHVLTTPECLQGEA